MKIIDADLLSKWKLIYSFLYQLLPGWIYLVDGLNLFNVNISLFVEIKNLMHA